MKLFSFLLKQHIFTWISYHFFFNFYKTYLKIFYPPNFLFSFKQCPKNYFYNLINNCIKKYSFEMANYRILVKDIFLQPSALFNLFNLSSELINSSFIFSFITHILPAKRFTVKSIQHSLLNNRNASCILNLHDYF